MIEAVMHCARCNGALKIVCDEHGTDFVPDRRMVNNSVLAKPRRPRTERIKTSPIQRGEVVAMPGSLREQLVAAVSTDPMAPSTAASVAAVTGRSAYLTGIDMSILCREGRLKRIGRGQYIRVKHGVLP